MKKLFLIFTICALILYSVMICYAEVDSKAANVMEDLPFVATFEPAESLKYLNQYNLQLQSIIAEQELNLNTLNSIYYLGSYEIHMDGSSMKRSLEWNTPFVEGAPLFKSELYKGYFNHRSKKVLEQYKNAENFNYTNFVKTARSEFDAYMKTALKDEQSKEQLTVLLQGKLYDKLMELDGVKKKELLEEALAIGFPANNSRAMDCIYQLFESRVRLQLSNQLVEMNKQKIQHLNQRIGIVITAEKKGQLRLQNKDLLSKDKAVEIINTMGSEEGYRGFTVLNELYNKKDYKLIFTEEAGRQYEIDLEKVIAAIEISEDRFLHIDLEKLITKKQEPEKAIILEKPTAASNQDNQLKSLELLYAANTKTAREIIKELNRYSIYLELKNKKVSNSYTSSFESGQKLWKKNLESKLNAFGANGMADFMAYIKQFELLDRKSSKLDKENQLIAKFRNSDIQFRKAEDGSLWITHMLFKLRNMK